MSSTGKEMGFFVAILVLGLSAQGVGRCAECATDEELVARHGTIVVDNGFCDPNGPIVPCAVPQACSPTRSPTRFDHCTEIVPTSTQSCNRNTNQTWCDYADQPKAIKLTGDAQHYTIVDPNGNLIDGWACTCNGDASPEPGTCKKCNTKLYL